MYPCPFCDSSILEFQLLGDDGPSRLRCPICLYVYYIKDGEKLKIRVPLEKKVIEAIHSDDDWKNAPPTDVTCPKCSHDKAACLKVPISDIETCISYKCLNEECKHGWCKHV